MLQIKPPVWFMALLLFTALSGTPALAAPVPTFSATASGTTSNLTLTAILSIGDADVGQYGNVYLAAMVGSAWFAHNGADWVQWSGGSLPVYAVGPLANRSIEVVRNADLSTLVGTQVYVGYGLSENDMLTYGKYGLVYTIASQSVDPFVALWPSGTYRCTTGPYVAPTRTVTASLSASRAIVDFPAIPALLIPAFHIDASFHSVDGSGSRSYIDFSVPSPRSSLVFLFPVSVLEYPLVVTDNGGAGSWYCKK